MKNTMNFQPSQFTANQSGTPPRTRCGLPSSSCVLSRATSPPNTSPTGSTADCPTPSAHIAHYNRAGFWDEFFTTTADKVRFLEQTLQHPCYGDPAWTYSDVERALQQWLQASGVLERYQQKLAEETEAAERAELAAAPA